MFYQSMAQLLQILWYFTPSSFQLSNAFQGDVTDSIDIIYVTFCSSFLSLLHLSSFLLLYIFTFFLPLSCIDVTFNCSSLNFHCDPQMP